VIEFYKKLAGKHGLSKYQKMEFDAQVYVDPTETYTVVVVSGERYTGVGVAKRNAADDFDLQTGFDLALGRALKELAGLTVANAGKKPKTTKYTYEQYKQFHAEALIRLGAK
jgi:hypothetical protein